MKIMIIGGGTLGEDVATLLREDGNAVTIFEVDKETAEQCAKAIDALVINADGTEIEKLEDAGLENMDVFMALTGHDATNLMACQIARSRKVKKVIARITRERDKALFENIGVDLALSPLNISAATFKNAAYGHVKTLYMLNGKFELVELTLKEGSFASGKLIKELDFPWDARIMIVYRKEKVIIPYGDLKLTKEDRLTILASSKRVKNLKTLIEPSST